MSYIIENAGAIGFIFFFSIFILILVNTYILSPKESFNKFAEIPLKEDEYDSE